MTIVRVASPIFFFSLLISFTASGDEPQIDTAAVTQAQQAFVDRIVSEHGFQRSEVLEILEQASIDSRVLEAIARPVERVVPWYEYREIFLNQARIDAGVQFWQRNASYVNAATQRHGVEAEILVAIIGIESLFGQRMGRYRVLDSLSTLAFAYPPRAAFFASELESFLLLTREESHDILQALGSYAGAMGAGQFIPSSFRAYAIDANGDGRRDLWEDWQDILGSVANYFDAHGWRVGEPVIEQATRASNWSGPEPANSLDLDETVGSLSEMGYVFATDLPPTSPALIVDLERDEQTSEYWVGFHNFRVITRYNRSVKYALVAHQLSQAIRRAYEKDQTP